MTFAELESHLTKIGLVVENHDVDGQPFIIIRGVPIPEGGSHEGEKCEIALRRSDQNPWLPEPQIHVRPHLVTMGEKSSQASPVGPDWQYLSRRFDAVPTPQTYYAFIRTALGEL